MSERALTFEDVLRMSTASEAPPGWVQLTREMLDQVQPSPDLDAFFNGAEPGWDTVRHPELSTRVLTDELTARVVNRINEKRPGVELLVGPAGEGKTTALLQAVCALVLGDPSHTVLWRHSSDARATPDVCNFILEANTPCVLASDNAHALVRGLDRLIREDGRMRGSAVQLLLASRDTDWVRAWRRKGRGFDPIVSWKRNVEVQHRHGFGTVTREDAGRIVASWFVSGSGLIASGSQLAISQTAAAEALEKASEMSRDKGGALLGGLLKVRYSPESLLAHVSDLLEALDGDSVSASRTLADVLVGLSLMDMAGIEGVPTEVVAEYADVPLGRYRVEIERRLAREAFASANGDRLYSRHPSISQAVMQLTLGDSSSMDVERLAIELIDATLRVGRRDGFGAGYGEILDAGRRLGVVPVGDLPAERVRLLGKGLASHVRTADPRSLSAQVGLSTFHWDQKNSEAAVNEAWIPVLSRLASRDEWHDWATRSRGAFCQASTVFGAVGNHAGSVLLAAAGLSDHCRPDSLTKDNNLLIGLINVAYGLRYLYLEERSDAIAECVARTRGFVDRFVPTRTRERGYLANYARDMGIQSTPFESAADYVENLDRVLSEVRRRDLRDLKLQVWLESLGFTDLQAELERRAGEPHA